MKKTGILLMLFMCVNIMFSQKFGHINSLDLLQKMPDVLSAEKELEAHGKKLQTQIQNMYLEYEKKVTEFKNKESTLIPTVKEMQLRDIQQPNKTFKRKKKPYMLRYLKKLKRRSSLLQKKVVTDIFLIRVADQYYMLKTLTI